MSSCTKTKFWDQTSDPMKRHPDGLEIPHPTGLPQWIDDMKLWPARCVHKDTYVALRGMGCGASFVYSGMKNRPYRNPDIRINIIEATSIIDYDDTDSGSSCRQTPVIARQTPVTAIPRSASASLYKQLPDDNAPAVTIQQEFHINKVSSYERPASPIPATAKSLHMIHTDSGRNKDEVPLAVL